ncbi:MAG: class I SAM-dependent methyltransferase, partial [Actinomycetota bacterium]|nr:class I SAM-dependent methyltransferase [Actinomycetota bacterium]
DAELRAENLEESSRRLPGPAYYQVLTWIHSFLGPANYVEIGVHQGISLTKAERDTPTIGIDPAPNINPRIEHDLPDDLKIYELTSDEFFAQHDVEDLLGGPVELAFIDGLHLFEQVLRDFINVERRSAAGTVILLHDCLPLDEVTASRERTTDFYSGDVWKATLAIRRLRPELEMTIVRTAPSGLCLIRGLDRQNRCLEKKLPEVESSYRDLGFDHYSEHRAEMPEEIPNEPDAVADWLRRTAAPGDSFQMREQALQRELDRVSAELVGTRELLDATRRELESFIRDRVPTVAEEPLSAETTGHPPAAIGTPPPGRTHAIDYAVAELGIESFVSLETGHSFGQYALYTIDKPTVRSGVLLNVGVLRPRDQLLNVTEQAGERPGLRVLDGSFGGPRATERIGDVDAVLVFDALMRMVDPDWDEVLARYAPLTSCFVIVNPQWEGEDLVRLIDLGREGYLEAVPPWQPHLELFDRLDDWIFDEQRPFRDAPNVWQWGLTDAGLEARMTELGFALERKWSLNPIPKAEGFFNRAFVFSRTNPKQPPSDENPKP